jgi:hypothetical protein
MPFTLAPLPQSVVVVHKGEGAEDDYGNVTSGETGRDTYPGRMWQQSGTETNATGTVVDLWHVILPAAAVVDAGDDLEESGRTFTVQGTPERVMGATTVHHVEVLARYVGPVP